MTFHENRLLADDSHEKSNLIFLKIRKNVAKLSSASVVIGALKLTRSVTMNCFRFFLYIYFLNHL